MDECVNLGVWGGSATVSSLIKAAGGDGRAGVSVSLAGAVDAGAGAGAGAVVGACAGVDEDLGSSQKAVALPGRVRVRREEGGAAGGGGSRKERTCARRCAHVMVRQTDCHLLPSDLAARERTSGGSAKNSSSSLPAFHQFERSTSGVVPGMVPGCGCMRSPSSQVNKRCCRSASSRGGVADVRTGMKGNTSEEAKLSRAVAVRSGADSGADNGVKRNAALEAN